MKPVGLSFNSTLRHHLQGAAPEVQRGRTMALKLGSSPGPCANCAGDGTGIHTSLRNSVLGVRLSPRAPVIGMVDTGQDAARDHKGPKGTPSRPFWETSVMAAQGTPNPLAWVQPLRLPPFGSVSVVANAPDCRSGTHRVNTGGSTPSRSTIARLG